VKNIQVIDGALNAVYDIFQATDEELSLIFPRGRIVRHTALWLCYDSDSVLQGRPLLPRESVHRKLLLKSAGIFGQVFFQKLVIFGTLERQPDKPASACPIKVELTFAIWATHQRIHDDLRAPVHDGHDSGVMADSIPAV
jgi:hypothetical protein